MAGARLGRAFLVSVSLAAMACAHRSGQQAVPSPCVQPTPDVTRLHNIAYGSSPQQVLDLFVPQRLAGEPLLVLVHGGGWSSGDKATYGVIARHLSGCGIAVANINYPMGPQIRARDQAGSVLTALAWTQHRAAIYGYDGDRTSLMGHSAGAEIVALAVLDPELGRVRSGVRISGVITMAGLGYTPPQPDQIATLPEYLNQFYHTAFGPRVETWSRYDVTRFVHAGPPAWLVIHGRDDVIAPAEDSAAFAVALRQAGAVVEYVEQPDRDHDSIAQGMVFFGDDPVRSRVERFVMSR
ncbi:MAG: alpha/beta hydrolase [Candidatus Eremiobacteraeota bacterium]|nr:alpha/beta hydrolase [Candidatus Eremiobacteraeota bacterium]